MTFAFAVGNAPGVYQLFGSPEWPLVFVAYLTQKTVCTRRRSLTFVTWALFEQPAPWDAGIPNSSLSQA